MKPNYKLWFVLLILAPFVTQCGPPTTAAPAAPTIPPAVTIPVDAHTVTIATLEWPPYVGEKLAGNGFTTEIVKTAFERAGYKVVVTFLPWARGLQETEDGAYDIIFPAYYSEERTQKYLFSEPFATSPVGFYKRKGEAIPYTKLEDLKPYRIGVVRGFVNTAEFDAASYLQKDVVDSDEQNLRKLVLNRIDLAVVDKFVAQSIFATTFPEGKEQLEFVEPPLDVKPLYIMASRKIPDGAKLIGDFNASLKQMTADGTIDQIMAKFGFQK
jgi:ABC-type amino acid transport substrate-binding protein